MGELFEVMATQHGVASSAQARAMGIGAHAENDLVRRGVIGRPAAGVLVSPAAPRTWHQRAIEAVFAPGDAVLSHAAAARLHGLDGFDRYAFVDVLCRKGWWPHPPPGTITHFTRGLTDAGDVTEVDSIRVLTVPATLTLLAPTAGLGPTARALDQRAAPRSSPRRTARGRDPVEETRTGRSTDAVDAARRTRWSPSPAQLVPAAGEDRPRANWDPARRRVSRSRRARNPDCRARPRRTTAQDRDRVPIVAMARHARRPTSRRPPTRRAPNSRVGDRRRVVA